MTCQIQAQIFGESFIRDERSKAKVVYRKAASTSSELGLFFWRINEYTVWPPPCSRQSSARKTPWKVEKYGARIFRMFPFSSVKWMWELAASRCIHSGKSGTRGKHELDKSSKINHGLFLSSSLPSAHLCVVLRRSGKVLHRQDDHIGQGRSFSWPWLDYDAKLCPILSKLLLASSAFYYKCVIKLVRHLLISTVARFRATF